MHAADLLPARVASPDAYTPEPRPTIAPPAPDFGPLARLAHAVHDTLAILAGDRRAAALAAREEDEHAADVLIRHGVSISRAQAVDALGRLGAALFTAREAGLVPALALPFEPCAEARVVAMALEGPTDEERLAEQARAWGYAIDAGRKTEPSAERP